MDTWDVFASHAWSFRTSTITSTIDISWPRSKIIVVAINIIMTTGYTTVWYLCWHYAYGGSIMPGLCILIVDSTSLASGTCWDLTCRLAFFFGAGWCTEYWVLRRFVRDFVDCQCVFCFKTINNEDCFVLNSHGSESQSQILSLWYFYARSERGTAHRILIVACDCRCRISDISRTWRPSIDHTLGNFEGSVRRILTAVTLIVGFNPLRITKTLSKWLFYVGAVPISKVQLFINFQLIIVERLLVCWAKRTWEAETPYWLGEILR